MLSRRISSVTSILRSSGVKSLYTATNRGFLIRPSTAASRYATSSDQNSTASRSALDTHFVTPLDRITLILTRTMKSEEIQAEVSPGTMDKANNRRRIGINMILVLITLVSGVWIIKKSQKGREEHTLVSLHEQNIQRYKKLREENAAAVATTAATEPKK